MKTQHPRFLNAVVFLGLTTAVLPRSVLALQSGSPIGSADPPTIARSVIRPGIPASDGELTVAVQGRVSRGDALTGMQRFAEAQREYRQAAEIARREGHLPSFTLWHLAGAYYYQGDRVRAADVMAQLAGEAADCGELAVQAIALFNAAWLNGQGGRGQTAANQLAVLTRLLRSPYMPVAVRDHLTEKLAFPGTVER